MGTRLVQLGIPCQQFDGFPSPPIQACRIYGSHPPAMLIQHYDIAIVILRASRKYNLGTKLASNAACLVVSFFRCEPHLVRI